MKLQHLIYLFCIWCMGLVSIALTSCGDDTESYPSIIYDFVTVHGDAQGQVLTIATDDGQHYAVDNVITGMEPNSSARAICGYVVTENGHVQVYNITGIPLLRNISGTDKTIIDATGVASVWFSGGYINMHLLPKVYEGIHGWGFVIDTVTANAVGGSTHFLTLCHDQHNDAEAFTGHVYLSIQTDSISPDLTASDSLHFTINTYDGQMSWQFAMKQR